jgi:hypothetical protein
MKWKRARGTLGGEIDTGFWWENLRKTDYLEDLGVDGNMLFKQILTK